jgi:hypothetical protein
VPAKLLNTIFSRGARLIIGAAATDFNFNNELAPLVKKPADGEKLAANV